MYEHASVDDLVQIFQDTVVLYRKKPVYVNRVGVDRTLRIYDLEDMKTKVADVDVENGDLDFTPVPLGYCNINKDAFFTQRIPKRQYKQGLCKGNITANAITFDYHGGSLEALLTGKVRSLAHCIEGRYPSLSSAISQIAEGCRSVAFGRKLAIDSDFNLFYKTTKIGVVDGETEKMVLNRSMKYLEGVVHAK